MPPLQDPLSIERRPLDVEDYIDILRRHKAWIIGPTFLALVVSVMTAFFWPDTYVSEAVIRVVPSQVPERYVPTNVSTQMSQRINSMAQTILSRATLQTIIQTHGLYPRDRKRLPMEDIVEQMRKDVSIGNVVTVGTQNNRTPTTAFRVQFAYEGRILAQRVTQDLVSRFVDENIRERANQSALTTEFLSDRYEGAAQELAAIENKLTEYRMRNAGRLPEELQANLQQMRTLETQLSSLNAAVNRVTQDKLVLESQLAILRDQLEGLMNPASSVSVAVQNERVAELDRQIINLEMTLTGLLENYTETHPDVRRVAAQLDGLKKSRDAQLEQLEKGEPAPAEEQAAVSPAYAREASSLQASSARVQSLIEAKNLELEQYVQEQDRLDKRLRSYQQRIESSPLSQREYAQLTRDYELAKKGYDELSLKRTQSEIATDLETRKQGETLELLDPASLPQKPSEPNRLLITAIGTGLGFMLGLFVAGGREMKDTSLKNLKDVRAYTNLTILGSVPLLENDLVVRRKRRLTWLAWSTSCIIGLVVMLGSVYYYYSTRA